MPNRLPGRARPAGLPSRTSPPPVSAVLPSAARAARARAAEDVARDLAAPALVEGPDHHVVGVRTLIAAGGGYVPYGAILAGGDEGEFRIYDNTPCSEQRTPRFDTLIRLGSNRETGRCPDLRWGPDQKPYVVVVVPAPEPEPEPERPAAAAGAWATLEPGQAWQRGGWTIEKRGRQFWLIGPGVRRKLDARTLDAAKTEADDGAAGGLL